MNTCQLVGRLTRDVEIKYTDGGSSVSRFNIAVDRRFKKEGQADADFISCVSFGKTAEFIEKYFKKGQRIGITGHIQTGSYENKDGQKVYTTDVIVDTAEFVESKGTSGQNNDTSDTSTDDGFINYDNAISEELPFGN